MNALKTEEAKVYKALDKLEAVMPIRKRHQHLAAAGI